MNTTPDTSKSHKAPATSVLVAQVASLAFMWVFVIGIGVWIMNLLAISYELNDAPGASLGISLIAIPVFFALAGVLTYVFIGLHKEERRLEEGGPAP